MNTLPGKGRAMDFEGWARGWIMGKWASKALRIGYDDAVAALKRLGTERAGVRAVFDKLAAEKARVAEAMVEPNRKLQELELREKRLRQIVDKGPVREKTTRGLVENPNRANELVAHQLAVEAGQADGVDVATAEPPGVIEVDIRLSTRIGGLARLGDWLDEGRLKAAARFRSCWDDAQIGGARAIDYTVPRVDTSGGGAMAALSRTEDAVAEYSRAVQQLGMIRANLVQGIICQDMSLRELARKLGRPAGGKATEKLRDEVLEAVDRLVAVFGTGASTGRRRVRAEGERLPLPAERTEVIYRDSAVDDRRVNTQAA